MAAGRFYMGIGSLKLRVWCVSPMRVDKGAGTLAFASV